MKLENIKMCFCIHVQSTLVITAKLGARHFAVISNLLLYQFDSIFHQELLPFDFYTFDMYL